MTLVDEIHERLWTEGPAAPDLEDRARQLVAAALPLATDLERERTVAGVLARVWGLGVLDELANDPEVTEIMINAGTEVWTERRGVLVREPLQVAADDIEQLVRRQAARVGRRIDRSRPAVEVRLPDGSRLHAVLPPLAVDGVCVTIRRFASVRPNLEAFAPLEVVELLEGLVRDRASIIVAGATSSGKTSLLNALGRAIGSHERVITIEDAAELDLPGEHVVRLETRAGTEGLPGLGIRELVRQALRMRPDRIICGEMRGAEALDLVQAMNTGHPGSMSTVHANTPMDAIRRMETMVATADAELPLPAIRAQVASCIDIVVMTDRGVDGVRTVSTVAEVTPTSSGAPAVSTLWCRGASDCDESRSGETTS